MSENSLSTVTEDQLSGPREMVSLQLDRNQLNCIDHRILSPSWETSLEVFTLNGNNLNTLEELPIGRMNKLRVLFVSRFILNTVVNYSDLNLEGWEIIPGTVTVGCAG